MSSHTRIPNRILDWILPRLRPAETACLLYIARRTVGFAKADSPKVRKQWDRISLSQFVDGVCSGEDPLDLGTGLSRRSVIDALQSLLELKVISVTYSCPPELQSSAARPGCGWSGNTPPFDERTSSHGCPRCGRTVSRLFALRELSDDEMLQFLEMRDPQRRRWYKSKRTSLFTPVQPVSTNPPSETLPAQLWFPELTAKLIEQAAGACRAGQLSPGRKVAGFYRPSIALQQQLDDREMVRHALQQTIDHQVCARSDTRAWPAYAASCAANEITKRRALQSSPQGPRQDPN
jgi:hypothetical protein